MEPENSNITVEQLCIASTRAEFAGRVGEARALAEQAWELAGDDYEACLAAHYVARYQTGPEEKLRWNALALARAQACGDARVQAFYASLYLNLGHSYELLGDQERAQEYFMRAAGLGLPHELD